MDFYEIVNLIILFVVGLVTGVTTRELIHINEMEKKELQHLDDIKRINDCWVNYVRQMLEELGEVTEQNEEDKN